MFKLETIKRDILTDINYLLEKINNKIQDNGWDIPLLKCDYKYVKPALRAYDNNNDYDYTGLYIKGNKYVLLCCYSWNMKECITETIKLTKAGYKNIFEI